MVRPPFLVPFLYCTVVPSAVWKHWIYRYTCCSLVQASRTSSLDSEYGMDWHRSAVQQQQLQLPGPSSTGPGDPGNAAAAVAAKHSRDEAAAAADTAHAIKLQRLSHCNQQQQPRQPAVNLNTSFADLQQAFPGSEGVELLWSVALQVHGPNVQPAGVQVAPVLQLWGDADTLEALRSSIAAADKTYCQHTLQVGVNSTAKGAMGHFGKGAGCMDRNGKGSCI
jgi:hypothetical protein